MRIERAGFQKLSQRDLGGNGAVQILLALARGVVLVQRAGHAETRAQAG